VRRERTNLVGDLFEPCLCGFTASEHVGESMRGSQCEDEGEGMEDLLGANDRLVDESLAEYLALVGPLEAMENSEYVQIRRVEKRRTMLR
jgi:hypothetical protein